MGFFANSFYISLSNILFASNYTPFQLNKIQFQRIWIPIQSRLDPVVPKPVSHSSDIPQKWANLKDFNRIHYFDCL
jgi:hypothetical protein